MVTDRKLPEKYWPYLLTAICTFISFYLPYLYRAVDDNRLTSWNWAFAHIELSSFIPIFIVAIFIAYRVLNFSFLEKYQVITLLILSFTTGMIFWSEPELIIDASRYFTHAKHLEIYGISYFFNEWGNSITPWTDLPFVPFLYGLIFKYIGESRLFIQAFTTSLFAFTTIITYLIGKRLWDGETGFHGALLMMGIPYIYSQVPLMLVDIPTMFFLTLTIYTFILAIEKGGIWITLSSISIFCAVFSKYSSWLMLSVLFVIFFVFLIRTTYKNGLPDNTNNLDARTLLNRLVQVSIITTILIATVAAPKFDVFYKQINFLKEYQMPGLRRWGESFLSTFVFQVHPFITLGALYSVYRAIRKKDIKFLIISWMVLLVIVLQIRRARYVLIVFPMLTLMAAYGMQSLKHRGLKRCILSSAVASSLVISVFAYLPFLKSISMVNLKDAGEYINRYDAEQIEVITVPSDETVVNMATTVPILDLSTDREIKYLYNAGGPESGVVEKSPLRFTWTYRNPEYYSVMPDKKEGKKNIVIISNGPLDLVPVEIAERTNGMKIEKIFSKSTEIFRFSPVVTVYTSGQEVTR